MRCASAINRCPRRAGYCGSCTRMRIAGAATRDRESLECFETGFGIEQGRIQIAGINAQFPFRIANQPQRFPSACSRDSIATMRTSGRRRTRPLGSSIGASQAHMEMLDVALDEFVAEDGEAGFFIERHRAWSAHAVRLPDRRSARACSIRASSMAAPTCRPRQSGERPCVRSWRLRRQSTRANRLAGGVARKHLTGGRIQGVPFVGAWTLVARR